MFAKKKGKFIVMIAVVALLLGMVFSSMGAAAQKDEPVTIGVVYINLAHPFFIKHLYAGLEAARDFNAKVIWKSAEGSLEKEISIIESFVEQGVDAILIDPIDRFGIITGTKIAHDAGIATQGMGNLVEDGFTVCTLYGDYHATLQTADKLAERIGYKGNVVLLIGNVGNYCNDQRQGGMVAGLEKYPEIKILAQEPTDWDPVKALNTMQNLLVAYPQIDAMYCVSDACTLAAVDAIKAAGRMDEIAVFSQDGSGVEALKSVESGDILGTLLTGAERAGYWQYKVGIMQARGEDVPLENFLPTYWITPDTTDLATFVAENYRMEFSGAYIGESKPVFPKTSMGEPTRYVEE